MAGDWWLVAVAVAVAVAVDSTITPAHQHATTRRPAPLMNARGS
ncbi:hypothetical protein ACFWED_26565 [Streptomyces anulatus]